MAEKKKAPPPKKGKTYKYNRNYSIEGGKLTTKNKKCPKCGDSFLAQHKNRTSCGRCAYTEMK
ncbi:MAG TPA: 30S ribosomal protein S27ae [Candidatus Nanoarchaeia archaeon]|nr:30S ribosomal protein S27ae [Candidatus Nanoarchaeia archaeon]